MQLPDLHTELWQTIVMQLPPRHLFKLMQTNEKFYELCRSEQYWRRVALQFVWRRHGLHLFTIAKIPRDMVLLSKSYNTTMEDFIKDVRTWFTNNMFEPDTAKSSVRNLLMRVQKLYNRDLSIPGETAFQLVKRYVEDSEGIPQATQNIIDQRLVPVETGLITAHRHATRAMSTFLRSLEDESSMDLDMKRRVVQSVRILVYTCTLGHIYKEVDYDSETGENLESDNEEIEIEKITPRDLDWELVGS